MVSKDAQDAHGRECREAMQRLVAVRTSSPEMIACLALLRDAEHDYAYAVQEAGRRHLGITRSPACSG